MNSKLHYADICKVSQEVLCMGEGKATFKQRAVEWPLPAVPLGQGPV